MNSTAVAAEQRLLAAILLELARSKDASTTGRSMSAAAIGGYQEQAVSVQDAAERARTLEACAAATLALHFGQ